ncbi:zf-HC2 domain-containing protein [Corynebacterium sp. UMB8791]
MISHDEIQACLSARLDGEQPSLDDAIVDAHLAQCEECAAFWEQALSLSQTVRFAEVDGNVAPPSDLADAILAGVNDPWHAMMQRRQVNVMIGRAALCAIAVCWIVWAIVGVVGVGEALAQTPEVAAATLMGVAVRFGVGLSLGLASWKPAQIPGIVLIVGTMFTFTLGFAVLDAVQRIGAVAPMTVIAPGIALLALAWTWIADKGVSMRRAWHLLNADPSGL